MLTQKYRQAATETSKMQHCFLAFGLPSDLRTEAKNPHCLYMTWKKADGPVTGYRIYCFPGDSKQAEIIKDIHGCNLKETIISGLRPETEYRVGITSISVKTESNIVLSEQQIRMRKCIILECFSR